MKSGHTNFTAHTLTSWIHLHLGTAMDDGLTLFDIFGSTECMSLEDEEMMQLLSELPLPTFTFEGDCTPPEPEKVVEAVEEVEEVEAKPRRRCVASVTHSRKSKHATRHVRRAMRERTNQSYLFSTVQEEAHYRLFSTTYDKRAEKLNQLLRLCYSRFGEQWVTWNAIKEVAREVGYSKTNSLFRTMWPMVSSRYGRASSGARNCEVLGLNFPYWVMDTSTRAPQGMRAGNTLLRLAPEFFTSTQSTPTHADDVPSFTAMLTMPLSPPEPLFSQEDVEPNVFDDLPVHDTLYV
jgi:hypothetical protein